MAYINEPVTWWEIKVTELVGTPGGDERTIFNVYTFKTMAEFREYLWKPDNYTIAKSLGYNLKVKPPPEKYNERLTGRLAFDYKDRFVTVMKEFANVNKFAEFLEEHPLLARAVEYVPKKNH